MIFLQEARHVRKKKEEEGKILFGLTRDWSSAAKGPNDAAPPSSGAFWLHHRPHLWLESPPCSTLHLSPQSASNIHRKRHQLLSKTKKKKKKKAPRIITTNSRKTYKLIHTQHHHSNPKSSHPSIHPYKPKEPRQQKPANSPSQSPSPILSLLSHQKKIRERESPPLLDALALLIPPLTQKPPKNPGSNPRKPVLTVHTHFACLMSLYSTSLTVAHSKQVLPLVTTSGLVHGGKKKKKKKSPGKRPSHHRA
ncbi:hypothetical protein V8C35DRAFT_32524 [Trichoderma chlorosporum]